MTDPPNSVLFSLLLTRRQNLLLRDLSGMHEIRESECNGDSIIKYANHKLWEMTSIFNQSSTDKWLAIWSSKNACVQTERYKNSLIDGIIEARLNFYVHRFSCNSDGGIISNMLYDAKIRSLEISMHKHIQNKESQNLVRLYEGHCSVNLSRRILPRLCDHNNLYLDSTESWGLIRIFRLMLQNKSMISNYSLLNFKLFQT